MTGANAQETCRISMSQLAIRAPSIGMLKDPCITPSRSRIRSLAQDWEAPGPDLLTMATMIRAREGGPLRLNNNEVLGHENGVYISRKGGAVRWEGETQLFQIISSEVAREATFIASESVRFEIVIDGMLRSYTVDVEETLEDGTTRLTELKRDEHDLDDPDYRLMLAYVAEICRRCGIEFRVVLRHEVFASRLHRRNAELFASRAFATLLPEHKRALNAHAAACRFETTYGELAAALAPQNVLRGKNLVQALVVRRRVEMDLTTRLHSNTPVRIY